MTARTLLLKFLDLRGMSPDLEEWTEERLSDNPPRLYRLQQLMALFRAFGLPWEPEAFTEGQFIQPEEPRYAAVVEKLTAEMPRKAREWAEHRQLRSFFAILFRYRARAEGVLSFSSGVLEASGFYLHAHRTAGEVNKVIREKLAGIEDTLASLISPEGAVFTVEQLVSEYGYPNVDLLDIDSDWW